MKSFVQVIAARVGRVACGVDIGFADVGFSGALRERFGGQWMTVVRDEADFFAVAPRLPAGTVLRLGAESALPFEDCQFDVAVLNGSALSLPLVREIHRILKPSGQLFFRLEEKVRRGPDSTSAQIYNSFLRAGFNVASLVRSPWWTRFSSAGRQLTVAASRKNWREQKGFAKR